MAPIYPDSLKLGKLQLRSPVIYSPLAGCSDYPFRKIAARYQPGLMFCEMVKMDALIRRNESTLKILEYSEDMRPIGGQIVGSKVELAADCAKMIQDMGFDVVDLNCGCPVDKVTKDGSGSAMLRDLDKMGEILSQMVQAVSIPVTVKIRIGWDSQNIVATEAVKIAEQAGAVAVFIHGRTRSQGYTGPADWRPIAECKKVATSIKVIGNGDVFSPEAAMRMFDQTGCDGVLVSRGTLGEPWIVEDICRALKGLPPVKREIAEYKQALLDHLALSEQFKSEKGALIDMRKVCCWYLKNSFGARHMRAEASKIDCLASIRKLIENFHD